MPYFAGGSELHEELTACLEAFFASPEGTAARESVRAQADSATVVLHLTDPEAMVTVDFLAGTVGGEETADSDVEVQLEADDLHDILLERLDPVQISRLYETDRLAFRGTPRDLAALIVFAGPLARFYAESLQRRGRNELLATPAPEYPTVWFEESAYRELIGKRRPWQRTNRTAA